MKYVAIALSTLAMALAGCATTFEGSAKVPKGAAGCQAKCDAQGLHFAGMIMLGEYSDGCICTTGSEPPDVTLAASAGGAASAAGVIMQMRKAQAHRGSR